MSLHVNCVRDEQSLQNNYGYIALSVNEAYLSKERLNKEKRSINGTDLFLRYL